LVRSRAPRTWHKFIESVDQAVEKIGRNPLAYRKVKGQNRRVNLDRFPYALFYRVDGDAIVVACVGAKSSRKGLFCGSTESAARLRGNLACYRTRGNINMNKSNGLSGGESGIRTHGTLRYTRFPSVRLKPLGHLSR
jgi:plasmid stabilization system protein ParE